MAESLLTGLICSSMKLKDSKAPGDDGIIPEFLKNVANEISVPLGMIYTKSLAEGVVPRQMWHHFSKMDHGLNLEIIDL